MRKMALDNDNALPSKYNQTPIRPSAAGPTPQGAVAAGRARKPPPMVVPAISAAWDATVVVVDVVSAFEERRISRLRLSFTSSFVLDMHVRP